MTRCQALLQNSSTKGRGGRGRIDEVNVPNSGNLNIGGRLLHCPLGSLQEEKPGLQRMLLQKEAALKAP